MREILGSNVMGLNNIPRNIDAGYGLANAGKIEFATGQFGFYTTLALTGSDNKPLNTKNEVVSSLSLEMKEVPCDKNGNILLDHYEISQVHNSQWPGGPNFALVMFCCSAEPTHRVNITSGEISDNSDDDNYLRFSTLSWIISKS